MAKADGQIIIDTLIDTKGTSKDTIDLQEQFEKLAKRVEAISRKINEALKTIDAKPVSKNVNEALDDVDPDKAVEPIQEGLDNIDASKVPEEVNQELGNIDATAPVAEINGALDGVDASGLDTKISEPIEEGFEKARKSSKENTEKIKDDTESIGEEAEKTGNKLGDALAAGFRKVGAAVAAVAVTKVAGQLVDFGKQAIELASDLEEVQNVVDTTFGSMSEDINQFAREAQKSAGMSEVLAKRYTGMFGAMAKSFGYSEKEAAKMAKTVTQLAGDVASFYNLSQDEAANKLKGIFTGETEALKELGVVMTQTALDAYALENGFDKTTAAMTEQEKVTLRYQFVMDQLADASGDFVRTQDSWANQTKVLNLQFETLMATVGGGLIDALTPALQFVNDKVLPSLQGMADFIVDMFAPTASDNLSKSLETLTSKMEDAEKQYEDTSKEIERNAIKASYYADRLKELEDAGLDTAEAQKEYADTVELLNELYPELNLKISEQTGLLDDNSRAMLDNIDAMKVRYLREAREKRYSDALEAQAEAILDIEEAEKALYAVRADMVALEQELSEATAGLNETTTSAAETARNLPPEVQTLQNALRGLYAEEQALVAAIADGKTQIAEYDAQLQEWGTTTVTSTVAMNTAAQVMRSFTQEATNAAQKIVDLKNAQAETTATVEELREEYALAQDAARKSIDSQIGYFDELALESEVSSSEIVKNWNEQKKAFDNYRDNLKKAIDMGLDEALVRQLSDGSTESMAILDEFVNSADMSVDEINASFASMSESRENVSNILADISTSMSQRLDEMYDTLTDEWGEMAGAVRASVSQMQTYIDGLTGKKVYVDVVMRQNGSPSGSSSSTISPTSAISPMSAATYRAVATATPQLPYLAKGTVIPPNAPFMAVLGDQRHGTNVEAPLSTIQEAVAVVMEDMVQSNLAGHEATVSVLQEILQAILGIEIGDTVIGQATARYNQKMAIVRGLT